MIKNLLLFLTVIVEFMAFSCSADAAISRYTVTDLGALPGYSWSDATGLNDNGQVAGYSWDRNDLKPDRASLFSDGQVFDLGTYDNSNYSYNYNSRATDINNQGQIIGSNIRDDGKIPGLYSYIGNGKPSDINNSGQVVGQINYSYAYLYSGGQMNIIGKGNALGINDAGQIVGCIEDHAYLYSGGQMQNLGTLGGRFSTAVGVNNNGQIIGNSSLSNGLQHAFFYSNGKMQDLGAFGGLESYALGINDSGQVIGKSYSLFERGHFFLYSGDKMYDLESLIDRNGIDFYELTDIADINNKGQIAATASINGQRRAVLLSPVPLPAAAWLFFSGFIGLISLRRKKVAH